MNRTSNSHAYAARNHRMLTAMMSLVHRSRRQTTVVMPFEQLESRRLLTSMTFSQYEIMSTDHDRPVAAVLADLDADGDLDIVSASSGDRKIAWYENTDGVATFSGQKVIASGELTPTSMVVSDLNGDNRLDIVVGTANEDAGIVWYPQEEADQTFRNASVISKISPRDLEENGDGILGAADLDGDGDNDILAASGYRSIIWFENLDGRGTFGNEQVISHRHSGLTSVSDVDGDGDLDVLVSGVVLANVDGKGDFVAQPKISPDSPSVFTAADVDGDGDPDLITNHSWFENTDGLGNFGTPRTFTDRSIHGALPVDVDNDGDVDILTRNEFENSIWWIENTDAQGTFERGGTLTLSAKGVGSLLAGDLDGDGDTDVISVSSRYGDDTIGWFENLDSLGRFGEQKQITQSVSGAESVHAADLDGDGDLDVLSASANDGKIAWHMNLEGEGTFGEQVLIDQRFARAQEVHTVDIDEDGDLDVLATFMGGTRHDADGERVQYSPSLRWYENVDGQGNFSEGEGELIGALPEYTSLRIRDVDGDGRGDIMVFERQGVSWYRNLPEAAGFSDRRTILNVTDTRSVGLYDAVDFDSDGDQDVVRIHWPKIVTLHENEGGRFTARNLGSEEGDRSVQSIEAADMDGDGDIDILTASVDRSSVTHCLGFECNPRDLRVSWRENTDGLGTMGEAQVLFATPTPVGQLYGTYYNDLSAVDVDHDGDLDVVMVSSMDLEVTPGASVDEVVWFENLDGKGTFGTPQTITAATDGIRSLTIADLDSDGDVDILSASRYDNTIAWYESDLIDRDQRIPGDANGNGEVAFADFLVLSSNFGKQVDAVWAEGDFNEDGNVSFEDFLILSANFSRAGNSPAT